MPQPYPDPFLQLRSITAEEIENVITFIKPWKAPGGLDKLPLSFLRACGQQLFDLLAQLASSSLAQGYFPKAFRHAKVIVLPKPGKSVAELQQPKGYRPISLLSYLGKIIETAIARALTKKVKSANILPQGQMGFRPKRSINVAAKLVTELVATAWSLRGTASLS